MKPDVLLTAPAKAEFEAALDAAYTVHRLPTDDHDAFLVEVGPRIRGVATWAGFGLPNAIMDALPRLEIIAVNGVGTDRVDLDHARGRGVRVTTTPDVLTEDVADLAIGLWLATVRRIAVADRYVRAGDWGVAPPFVLTPRASGRRVGVVGLGKIGAAIARRAAPFAAEIAYSNRRPAPDAAYRYFPQPAALAAWADVLFIVTPGGPSTHNLIDAEVIAALGPQGVLINVARGSVVDEAALTSALVEGRLGGAGLDVFADEPHVPQALLALDTVVLQPHLGSATIEGRGDMADLVLANLAAHFAGDPLLSPVV
jgi:lactate dehydrogenase-like 2-hydroxyacid dehydrogenase